MALGCAANQPQSESEKRMWQAQKEREEQTARTFSLGGG
jgi:hypothetical protein